MSAEAENELTPPADDAAGTEPVSASPSEPSPDPAPDLRAPIVEWPGARAADRPHSVREITRLATERQSPWRGRMIAGAVGAGLTLVGLALRDTLGGRRSPPPPPPPTLRRRAASWLRGEDR
jgi:hypothetical protein